MKSVSDQTFRNLSLSDIGLDDLCVSRANRDRLLAIDVPEIDKDDPILSAALAARDMDYAGVILIDPPGTGKSWYAQQIAIALSGSWEAVRSVQFHPSYQYEDFVLGYVAGKSGQFEPQPKEFVRICRDAAGHPSITYVLVIDEISRSDVARVFGEALTYIEIDKRDRPFLLASGEELTVPRNLFLVCTMNSWDTGVDEIDVALQRRFAQVDVNPNGMVLKRLLSEKGATDVFLTKLLQFFDWLQATGLDSLCLGHAYFLQCEDENSAKRTWEFRIYPTVRRACGSDRDLLTSIEQRWRDVVEISKHEIDPPKEN